MSVLLTLDERLSTIVAAAVPLTSVACTTQGWVAPTELWEFSAGSGNYTGINGGVLQPTASILQNRGFYGLPQTGALIGAVGCESKSATTQRLTADSATPFDLTTEDYSISWLLRTYPVFPGGTARLLAKWVNNAGLGYRGLSIVSTTGTTLRVGHASGANYVDFANCLAWDGGVHLLSVACDRDGLSSCWFDGNSVVTASSVYPTTMTNTVSAAVLNNWTGAAESFGAQLHWLYWCKGSAVDGSGHAALWSTIAPWADEYTTHIRTGRVSVQVAANYVSTFGPGQPAHVYDTGTSEVGLLALQPLSFLGINGRAITAWTGTSATNTAADGPDGFNLASRVALTGANGYISSGTATFAAGSSNQQHRFSVVAKRATTGAELRVWAVFSGDAGGAETFTVITTDALAAGWTRYTGSCTPTRSGHTSCVVRIGAATSGNNLDVQHPAGAKTAVDFPGWILTAAGASEAAAAQAVEINNNGSLLYGSRGVVQAALQNLNAVSGKHVAVWAESDNATPYLEMGASGADLYITIRDSSRSLVGTVTATSAITGTHHAVEWHWNASTPVSGSNYIMIKVDGVQVAAGVTSSWTPPTDDLLSPIGIGYGNAANELHGAFSSIVINDSVLVLVDGGSLTAVGEGDASLTAATGIRATLASVGDGDASLTPAVGVTATMDASGEGDASLTSMLALSSGALAAAGEGDATLIKVPGYTAHTHAEVNDSTTQAVVTSACHRTKAIVTEHWED